jgi:hypothetical protein
MFMRRQTYTGKVCWIIVDDCEPRTTDFITDAFRPDWTVLKVYPLPLWRAGQNTQGRNLAAGINCMLANVPRKDIEAVYIIEDDDWYSAGYLEAMRQRIQGYWLAGETHTVYYNVYFRRWHENQNAEWGSLFQTVFTLDALPQFKRLYAEKFIDFVLFRMVAEHKNIFRSWPKLAIGIKGIKGRAGIGAGHQFTTYLIPDTDLLKLKEFIGDDVKYYTGYWDCGGA